jgi:hypothetical protein
VGISMLRPIGTRAVLMWSGDLKYHFTIRRLLYGVQLLLHEYQKPYFFNKLLIRSGISMTFFSSLFESTTEGEKAYYFIQDSATAHMPNYAINHIIWGPPTLQ